MNDMTRGVPAPITAFHVVPFEHMERMAAAIAKSGLFGMKTADQALALMLTAQAEGQHPATVTQDYDIIQGRAARKTHSVLARYQQAGGSIEWHALTDKIADATFTPPPGTGKPLRLQWTIDMAKAAKLAGKDNWVGYARAMLRARLIAEGARATYPAAIGGMLIDAEAQDLAPEKDVTPHGSHVIESKTLPAYEAAAFEKNLPKWRELIETNKKTADDIIATVAAKYTLTEAQANAIRAPKPFDAEVAALAILDKANQAEITDEEVARHIGIATPIKTVTEEQYAKALAFIADPAGSAQ